MAAGEQVGVCCADRPGAGLGCSLVSLELFVYLFRGFFTPFSRSGFGGSHPGLAGRRSRGRPGPSLGAAPGWWGRARGRGRGPGAAAAARSRVRGEQAPRVWGCWRRGLPVGSRGAAGTVTRRPTGVFSRRCPSLLAASGGSGSRGRGERDRQGGRAVFLGGLPFCSHRLQKPP